MIYLQHSFNGFIVHTYALDDGFEQSGGLLIGRASTCQVVLDDPTVSAEHARFFRDAQGQLCIEDLKSTNGLWLNGEKLESGAVRAFGDGDNLQLGEHEFSLQSELNQALSQTLKIVKSWIPGVYYTRSK